MGWLANLLLIYSWWKVGDRKPHAILVGVGGSVLWAIQAYTLSLWDLVTIEIVLGIIQLRSWLKWRNL